MDSLQEEQHQAMVAQQLEDVLACSKPQQERRLRPQPDQALKCPRCDSTNTKFCYYNNYSLSQPRYFCKGCRRYWTQGGSLRNVPVGGGCRKNKRNSSSKRSQDQSLTTNSNPLSSLSSLTHDSSDLTLAFARLHKQPTGLLRLGDHGISIMGNPSSTHCDVVGNLSTNITPGFLDCLRGDFLQNPSGFHNFYYGFGNGTIGGGGEEEVRLPLEDHSGATTRTEESYYKIRDEENKVFGGFQWQVGGDGNMVVDSARGYWNGVGSSSWQGLVNSPLM